MRLGDLTAQDEPDPGALRLRGEERHEEIGRLRDARAVVFDEKLHAAARPAPAESHVRRRSSGLGARGPLLERRFDGVFHEVDDELLDLRRIARQREIRAREKLHG